MAMDWIESHKKLRNHHKTRRLTAALGVEKNTVLGLLQQLWWWTDDYAPDGDLSGFDPDDIADAVEWGGDPDELVKALIECGPRDQAGFLDARMRVVEMPRVHRRLDPGAARERSRMTPAVRARVLMRDGNACKRCGATEPLEIDHVLPLARGGTTDLPNLQVLCAPCNRAKGTQHPDVWSRTCRG